MRHLRAWFLVFFVAAAGAAVPAATEQSVRQLWQLLDYVSVDYAGAVANGQVTKSSEYAEMLEFSSAARKRLDELPVVGDKDALIAQADALQKAIVEKSPPARVAKLAHGLADAVLASYPIPIAPSSAPDLARGAAVFAQQCVSCHGPKGGGDGPLAARLDPRPIAFTDRDRARTRSILALYQAISEGVRGTSMPAFKQLSDADRWAVAFFAGNLSYDDAMRQRGRAKWQSDSVLRDRFDNLAALTRSSELALAESTGPEAARDVMAYLRSSPASIGGQERSGLDLARTRMRESMSAFRAGDKPAATRLALSAYLDGFEPLEPALAARNKSLLTEVESAMLAYRAAIADGNAQLVADRSNALEALLVRVESELDPSKAEPTTAFVGALTILLREGIEALLVVVGMIAFLKKAGRTSELRHIHVGWIGALAAGGLTWAAATTLVTISGANRELTEGASSVFAAVVLLGVGLWMHQKSAAGRWQAYLRDKMTSASRSSAYAMAGLAFVAVYREVFETVLFFSALWTEGNGGALLAGLLVGATILAGIAWAMLRTSARMPIGKFFSVSSVFVAVLAVVLIGKGVKALQEAGVFSAHPLASLRVDVLGIFPTDETLLAQLAVALVALLGFWFNSRLSGRTQLSPRKA